MQKYLIPLSKYKLIFNLTEYISYEHTEVMFYTTYIDLQLIPERCSVLTFLNIILFLPGTSAEY